MIRVGFIGVGGMGFVQSQAFAQAKRCKVVAASDPSEASRSRFAEAYPDAALYTDHKALLADANVDAVVISIPTGLHKDVASDCMKAGRPVLCEKPLARTVADCKRMIDVSEKTGQLLMVAHCRRFDTDWGTIAKIFNKGTIGAPVLWRHCSASKFSLWNPSKWFMDDKLGGGPLIDGAVHNWDFANYMFGKPESVLTSSIKLDETCTAIDTGTAIVRYETGNQLLLSWSWATGGGGLFDFIGPKGSIMQGAGDLATPELDQTTYGYYRTADQGGAKKKLVKFKKTNMYVTQAQHFIDCIEGKAKECLSPATEAIKAIAVAEAILTGGPAGREVKIKV